VAICIRFTIPIVLATHLLCRTASISFLMAGHVLFYFCTRSTYSLAVMTTNLTSCTVLQTFEHF